MNFPLQLLLSSSMDKTVRLWDLETKTCLKFFAHNDYGIISQLFLSHCVNEICLIECLFLDIYCAIGYGSNLRAVQPHG